MPSVIRHFRLTCCWTIAFACYFSGVMVIAQNSSNAASAEHLDSQAVHPQAEHRRDLIAVLSNRLHELFGLPLGEKPRFVVMSWPIKSITIGPDSKPAIASGKGVDADSEASGSFRGEKGDVAKGMILYEEKDTLYLARPCQNAILTFHSPYVKQRTGSATCNNKDMDVYVVTQR